MIPPECPSRVQALQASMREQGLSAMVVMGRGLITQYGSLQYLCGYCPIIRVGALILRPGHAPVLALPTSADVDLARPHTAIHDMRVAPVGEGAGGVSGLATLVAELCGDPEQPVIGVSGLEDILIAAEFERWKAVLPGAQFVAAGHLVKALKALKSPREFREIASAAAIADAGMHALVDALRAGATYRSAAGAAEALLRTQGAGEVLVYLSPGPHYRHRPLPGRPESGNLLTAFVELSNENGYWGEFSRLIAVGLLDAQAQALADFCVDSMDRMQQLLRPGATGAAIYAELSGHAKAQGYSFDASFGHGFGLDHDLPNISASGKSPIAPGMAISTHPQFITADGSRGASLGDAFVITGEGAATLSAWPRELIVL